MWITVDERYEDDNVRLPEMRALWARLVTVYVHVHRWKFPIVTRLFRNAY